MDTLLFLLEISLLTVGMSGSGWVLWVGYTSGTPLESVGGSAGLTLPCGRSSIGAVWDSLAFGTPIVACDYGDHEFIHRDVAKCKWRSRKI